MPAYDTAQAYSPMSWRTVKSAPTPGCTCRPGMPRTQGYYAFDSDDGSWKFEPFTVVPRTTTSVPPRRIYVPDGGVKGTNGPKFKKVVRKTTAPLNNISVCAQFSDVRVKVSVADAKHGVGQYFVWVCSPYCNVRVPRKAYKK